MKSLFNNEAHQEIINRLDTLNEETKANWGKMTVGQMLCHCQKPLEVANGKIKLNTQIGFFKKLLFKLLKPIMYNDKPYQKNLDTVREFRIKEPKHFSTERTKLVDVINEFTNLKDKTNWPAHPFFGNFNAEQWGQMQYKHLDHHLSQFGV